MDFIDLGRIKEQSYSYVTSA